MDYNSENATAILKMVEESLKRPDEPPKRFKKLWWTILYARARALSSGLRLITGDKVHGGPFKDMALTEEAIKQYSSPLLLGCYEHELHPTVETLIARDYDTILNIGCSVGYYAVGFARRCPRTRIEAYDIDPQARNKCADLAQANNVSDRVIISGQFYGDQFAACAGKKTLALVDIEGAETSLLDPDQYPALRHMDLLVELHDVFDPTISQKISDRFRPTHNIEIIKNRNFLPDVSTLLPNYIDPFDQLLLGWEGRDGETPWGVFIAKNQ